MITTLLDNLHILIIILIKTDDMIIRAYHESN